MRTSSQCPASSSSGYHPEKHRSGDFFTAKQIKINMSKITTVEHALQYLGKEKEKDESIRVDDLVYMVIEAINKEFNGGEPWKADFSNWEQRKYFIWWDYIKGSGFRFVDTHHDWTYTNTAVGPRLSFVSRAAAEHFGNTPEFVELINKMWS